VPDIELGKKVFRNITSTEKKAIAILPTTGTMILSFTKSVLEVLNPDSWTMSVTKYTFIRRLTNPFQSKISNPKSINPVVSSIILARLRGRVLFQNQQQQHGRVRRAKDDPLRIETQR
jgi:hypothetical protein